MNSRVFEALRPLVVETVGALQAARTGEEFVELQRALLGQFLRHQLTQVQARDRLTKLKASRSAMTRERPKPIHAIRAISEEIATDEFFDEVLSCALHVLRCLGDGVAWKVVDFDRRAITVMGQGRRVGRLADDAGLRAELAELDRLWSEEGRFAVHNDMTNCLRHGDLTIPTRLEGTRDIEIAEIKAGGKLKATQALRLDRSLAFLRAGYRAPAAGEEPGTRILAAVPRLRTYLPQLSDAIGIARDEGVADFTPHPCMTVAVADYRVLSARADRPDDWTVDAPRRRGWNRDRPRVIQSLSFARRLRERRNSFAFMAPYAIFPLRAEDIADLILGQLDVCTTISCDELEKALAVEGLQSEIAGGTDAESLFLRASDGANTVSLPSAIREQMLAELMTPDTLIGAIRHSLAATAADRSERPARHLVPYAGESDVWFQGPASLVPA